MINEWEEFLAYTQPPLYKAAGKRDTAFLGRFTMDMLVKMQGLSRVLTILARGYLFHNPDGSLQSGSPYDRTDHVRNALCAWCSIPKSRRAKQTEDWQFDTDFRQLHPQFPELVDAQGRGWYHRHVHGVADFILQNPTLVHKRLADKAELLSSVFDAEWRKKVIQFQVPLFSSETKCGWLIRFDDILADALELGPLRTADVSLPLEAEERIASLTPQAVPTQVVTLLAKYYIANRQEDCPWVVLPVTNFEAYLGSTAFSRMYLPKIPADLMERKEMGLGVSMYRFHI